MNTTLKNAAHDRTGNRRALSDPLSSKALTSLLMDLPFLDVKTLEARVSPYSRNSDRRSKR
jgi:hypothetical protein